MQLCNVHIMAQFVGTWGGGGEISGMSRLHCHIPLATHRSFLRSVKFRYPVGKADQQNQNSSVQYWYWQSFHFSRGTRWRSWLLHCDRRRKVAGSIPHGVIGIFHWHNPSGRTVALGLTQPLTEMGTRNTSWGSPCKTSWHINVNRGA